jgi:hypothetical protein
MKDINFSDEVRIVIPCVRGKNTKAMCKLVEEMLVLFDKKGGDYGDSGIVELGVPGLCYQIIQKVSRMKNLVLRKKSPPNFESLEDTCKDLANYALMMALLLRKEWVVVEKDEWF